MKIALAQVNSWLGDFAVNREKILAAILKAAEQKCDLVVFPEASLFGYHPCDLLERPQTVTAQLKELEVIRRRMPPSIVAIVGAFNHNAHRPGKPFINGAAVLQKGRRPKWFAKELLPIYDVFDEGRHIEPGHTQQNLFKHRGQKILITICEDIWAWPDPKTPHSQIYRQNPLKLVKGKVDLVINLSASPFTDTKAMHRHRVVKATARHFHCPMIYVNMVGAQDELIFDGGSFATDAKGQPLFFLSRFKEDFWTVDLAKKKNLATPAQSAKLKEPIDVIRKALVLGLQDYAQKTGFKRAHFGLSGGIDSAVVACLAVEALGSENVTAIALEGPFSDPKSLVWAKTLAERLKIEWLELPITERYHQIAKDLDRVLGPLEFGVMHENIQARLRGLMLMSIANQKNSLLLATSNKCELTTGYSTLYGDMTGALMPIGDLLKGQIYKLANSYNRNGAVIPQEIIDRPPSAELRPNQKDQDSLPPYDELDRIVENLVLGYRPAKSATEKRVLKMLMQSEFKRWQAPPILKVSDHAFGRGRRFPVAHRSLY
jgi:NAD+ synthase (glutamine-hydrolysing)